MDEIQEPGAKWKNRTGFLLLVLVVGVGGLVLWLRLTPQEPSYQGKPLRFWLSRAVDTGAVYDQTDPYAIECRKAIRSIGTNALPILLQILRAKDSTLKR